MREGYALEDDDGNIAPNQGPFPVPKDKTFILRDGRGNLTVPSGQRGDRDNLKLQRTATAAGSPYVPTGDPMSDGVGPASWVIPMNFAKIKGDRVVIRSLHAHNVMGIPTIKKADVITLLEEEKIMAYFGGGTMYADPSRAEPLI